MSKSRIPLTKGTVSSDSARKPDKQNFASSNLFHYGFVSQDKKPPRKVSSSKEKTKSSNEKSTSSEKTAVKKRASKQELLSEKTRTMEKEPGTENDGVEDVKFSNLSTPAHLNLSQTQLNALSYSLSELADKISPTKKEFMDEDHWDITAKTENYGDERINSLGRNKISADVPNKHSKTPYSRGHEKKHHLSKQKSFEKKQRPETESKLESNESAVKSDAHLNHNSSEQDDALLKAASPVHQESVESGYNSSWSASSISWSEDLRDGNKNNCDVDTDVEQDEPLSCDTLTNEDTKDTSEKDTNFARTLETKISDVEKRINSLILRRHSCDLETTDNKNDNSDEIEKKSEKDSSNEDPRPTSNADSNSNSKDSLKIGENKEPQNSQSELDVNQNNSGEIEKQLDKDSGNEDPTPNAVSNSKSKDSLKSRENKEPQESQSGLDSNQNNNESPVTSSSPKDIDHDLKKSPFQVSKVKKASLDDANIPQKPKRPGLVRRRTTLVTFRQPRAPSAFSAVDDSGVLEIDEAGFVQCLTDVRAMKTMLLKLKRELQEAEVQSPLGKVSSFSRSSSNLNESASEEGNRRHTYDSSEGLQEKLRRIRKQSLSRRKQSNCTESPLEDQLETHGDVTTAQAPSDVIVKNSSDDEMKKMKEEFEEMKEKMKELKQERDTLFMDKEEIEHELETKNHTIKMLQKQLEAQENSDEVTYLKRQVTSLTQQIRQQQQKISELKYRATSPGSAKKESVKIDIKNRLRDAFARHLEESSKSHLLLSKHIEKAELTISEAQKGLKSLSIISSPHTSSNESLTASDDADARKRRSSSTLATPPPRDIRRHSWTPNSIEKIIKTWKETTHSIENLTAKSPKSSKKSSKLAQPADSSNSSPHLSFL